MKIVKTFLSDKHMIEWLSKEENINKLKKKYPADKYSAELNLEEKRIELYNK